jgi:hypothetical protein
MRLLDLTKAFHIMDLFNGNFCMLQTNFKWLMLFSRMLRHSTQRLA